MGDLGRVPRWRRAFSQSRGRTVGRHEFRLHGMTEIEGNVDRKRSHYWVSFDWKSR